MKKIVSVLLILIMLLSLSACSFGVPSSQQPSKPILQYDHTTQLLYWNKVSGASEYKVIIYLAQNMKEIMSKRLTATSYSCSGLAVGSYVASVQAIASDSNMSDIAQLGFEIADTSKPNPDPTPDPEPTPDPTPPEIVWPDEEIEVDGSGTLVLPTELYYKANSNTDFVLDYAKGVNIDYISAKGLGAKYTIDTATNQIILDKSYLNQFTYGTKIALKIGYSTNKIAISYLNFVQYPPYAISDNNTVTYTKAATSIINRHAFTFEMIGMKQSSGNIHKVCVDDMPIANESIVYDMQNPIVKVRDNLLLQNLSVGKHKLQVFTDRGMSQATLNVVVSGYIKPYDVMLDADTYYPNIYITWKDNAEKVDKHQVTIGDTVYTTVTHPQLFRDTLFNATGLINKGDTYKVTAFVDRMNATSEEKTMSINVDSATEKKYLSQQFEFLGKKHNYYLTSQQELQDFAWYFIMHYDQFDYYTPSPNDNQIYGKYKQAKVYVNFDDYTASDINQMFNSALKKFPEALSASTTVASFAGSSEYILMMKLDMSTVPTNKTPTKSYNEYVGNVSHFGNGNRPADFNDFKIDEIEQTATMGTTYELYMAMERGYRPTPIIGSNAERIYNKAKAVLRAIIDDDMDDFAKVHAIYDWLSNNVVYDHDLANSVTSGAGYNNMFVTGNNSFYAEGVFDDGVAVCNGIAIAFDIMCRIEGIECYKIVGVSYSSTTKSVGHAWNKVKIGDYWYVCDATWASYGNSATKQEKHIEDYLFMTTPSSGPNKGGEHVQDDRNIAGDFYAGDTNYNVYANTWYVSEMGDIIDMVATDSEDLKTLVDYMTKNIEKLYGKKAEYRIIVDCSRQQWYDSFAFTTIRYNNWEVRRESHKGGELKSDLIIKPYVKAQT